MSKESTELQKWSRRRNFAKWRLRGVLSHLRGMKYTGELTLKEKLDLDVAKKFLQVILRDWNAQTSLSKDNFIGGTKNATKTKL